MKSVPDYFSPPLEARPAIDGLTPSLPEAYRSIPIRGATFWRKMAAFGGPGFMVAVGYMDPGNWATDLAGGSQFGYKLLCVILISNFMAILLQHFCARLGIATGRDLAQSCRDQCPKPVNFVLWILCELAICACDLAEVIGAAIALNLLFGIPMPVGVCLTVLDVMTTPKLVSDAKTYFQTVQLKDQKYDPVLTAEDQPAIHLNKELMEQMRPKMQKFYYDPGKYKSYLEQLGIPYPGVPVTK